VRLRSSRGRVAARARERFSVGITPSCDPSLSMTRTLRILIWSFIRSGRAAMATLQQKSGDAETSHSQGTYRRSIRADPDRPRASGEGPGPCFRRPREYHRPRFRSNRGPLETRIICGNGQSGLMLGEHMSAPISPIPTQASLSAVLQQHVNKRQHPRSRTLPACSLPRPCSRRSRSRRRRRPRQPRASPRLRLTRATCMRSW